MKTRRILLLGTVLATAVSVSLAAWAGHGKAGLWDINIQTNMGQMQGMPDMSKMPPEVQARMKAMGMQMNGSGMTVRHCMTAADVNAEKPNMSHNAECKAINVNMSGQTYSADLVCKGKMNATGHVQFTFASPEHYFGSETMTGTANGHPVNHTTKIDARWISADCGKVH